MTNAGQTKQLGGKFSRLQIGWMAVGGAWK